MKNLLCLLIVASLTLPGILSAQIDDEYLKVCADPYMLPFSNKDGEGYENKIAELFAEKLGRKLKYSFFPQRIGFIRNTLKAESEEGLGYKCDLVISVPENFELAATTDPYFTSAYVLVYAKGRKLDSITEPSQLDAFVNEQGNKVRMGLADRGPAQLWVFHNNLIGTIVPYQAQPGDPKVNPGKQFIDDIVSGDIDAAIVWGPTAGYYAKQYADKAELILLPLQDDPSKPEMRFTYSFSMAVRYGENEWKDKINQLIRDNKVQIKEILTSYGVPLVEN